MFLYWLVIILLTVDNVCHQAPIDTVFLIILLLVRNSCCLYYVSFYLICELCVKLASDQFIRYSSITLHVCSLSCQLLLCNAWCAVSLCSVVCKFLNVLHIVRCALDLINSFSPCSHYVFLIAVSAVMLLIEQLDIIQPVEPAAAIFKYLHYIH